MNTRNYAYLNVFRKSFLFIPVYCLLSCISFSQHTVTPKEKGYAPVNGLKMYYEIYGEGQPIVLLHGAFMTISTNFGEMIPVLSQNRKVIAVELQGHGHTADIDRPLTLESLADDVAGLLKYLKTDSADIFGYSLGGEVALQMAIRHAEMVKRLIIVSAVYNYDGWSPESKAIFPIIQPDFFQGTPIKAAYDSVAPDPGHFPELVKKIKTMITTPFDFTEKIKTIKAPVLIIVADGDGVLLEHTVEMYRLLGGNYMIDFEPVHKTQLAVFPGSSHISVMMHTDWMLSMVNTFLNASEK